ncbi:hypothetical protein ANANG_G00255970 [Anguilla anguilla]|uniref:Leucine-rich repeat-containing protein 3 n=1 Tax=Anguilla anguilla TaxID=7936 RepID=A0A9D3LVI0_ANGAN|nr:hypothetical protein ANANG_G00255970 [Anguilla anguilla]
MATEPKADEQSAELRLCVSVTDKHTGSKGTGGRGSGVTQIPAEPRRLRADGSPSPCRRRSASHLDWGRLTEGCCSAGEAWRKKKSAVLYRSIPKPDPRLHPAGHAGRPGSGCRDRGDGGRGLLLLLWLCNGAWAQCPERCHCSWESGEVQCTDAGLRGVPRGLPADTVSLHLERNLIRNIPEGAFRDLPHLRDLHLAHNRIESLSSGALRHLSAELRLLDLSHNRLRRASREDFGPTRAKTRLFRNPWHCDCALQELVEALNLEPETVNDIVCESSARGLGEGGRWEERKTTDVAMLVTMFVWFFMVIVYVVYYVRQNQAEARRHLEYLKSLPSPRKTPTETDTLSTGF